MFRTPVLISLTGVWLTVLAAGCVDNKPDTSEASPSPAAGSALPANPADGVVLELPPDVDAEAATDYERLRTATSPSDLAALANLSQKIGLQLVQSGNADGYRFFRQSASLARRAVQLGEPIPDEVVADWIYNEACAFARAGQTDAAMKLIDEAVRTGFRDTGLIETDADLKSLRATADFDKRLRQWQLATAERVRQDARDELAGGESFPFKFKLVDLDGDEQSPEKYRGQVVLIDIWGTWCGPCVAEIPAFIKLQKKYGAAGFQILGLAYERGTVQENQERLRAFIDREGINYPCMLGTQAEQDQISDFGAFPTTLFVDRTGRVRLKAVGARSFEHLDALVSLLLEERGCR